MSLWSICVFSFLHFHARNCLKIASPCIIERWDFQLTYVTFNLTYIFTWMYNPFFNLDVNCRFQRQLFLPPFNFDEEGYFPTIHLIQNCYCRKKTSLPYVEWYGNVVYFRSCNYRRHRDRISFKSSIDITKFPLLGSESEASPNGKREKE